jgi:hypothetical protein
MRLINAFAVLLFMVADCRPTAAESARPSFELVGSRRGRNAWIGLVNRTPGRLYVCARRVVLWIEADGNLTLTARVTGESQCGANFTKHLILPGETLWWPVDLGFEPVGDPPRLQARSNFELFTLSAEGVERDRFQITLPVAINKASDDVDTVQDLWSATVVGKTHAWIGLRNESAHAQVVASVFVKERSTPIRHFDCPNLISSTMHLVLPGQTYFEATALSDTEALRKDVVLQPASYRGKCAPEFVAPWENAR